MYGARMLRTMAARGLVAGIVLASVVATRTAHAAPNARLVYVRAADAVSCPDETAIRNAVSKRLGYDPFFPAAKNEVFAEIVRTERGFRATIKLVDDANVTRGERTLDTASRDCAGLTEAMALTISLALDPLSMTHPPTLPSPDTNVAGREEHHEEAAPPDAHVAHRAGSSELHRAAAKASRAERTRVTPFVAIGALVADGVAPTIALGGELVVGVRAGHFSIALGGRALAPASRSTEAGGTISVWRVEATLAPCAHLGPMFACAVVAAGAMWASSFDIVSPRSDSTAAARLGGRIGVLVPVTRALSVEVASELDGALVRPRFTIDGNTVFSVSAASGALFIGLRASIL
jgi:hypothetical protein